MAGKRRRARGSKKHGDANENSPSTLDVIHGDAVLPDGKILKRMLTVILKFMKKSMKNTMKMFQKM